MSRSYKDGRKGGAHKLAGEICGVRILGDHISLDTWDEQAGPKRKRSAKFAANRARRVSTKTIIRNRLAELD